MKDSMQLLKSKFNSDAMLSHSDKAKQGKTRSSTMVQHELFAGIGITYLYQRPPGKAGIVSLGLVSCQVVTRS